MSVRSNLILTPRWLIPIKTMNQEIIKSLILGVLLINCSPLQSLFSIKLFLNCFSITIVRKFTYLVSVDSVTILSMSWCPYSHLQDFILVQILCCKCYNVKNLDEFHKLSWSDLTLTNFRVIIQHYLYLMLIRIELNYFCKYQNFNNFFSITL
jgi:hypothetical protein